MRRAAALLAGISAAGALAGAAESRALRLTRRDLEVPGMSASLDGLTVLHVSDVHAGWGPGAALLGRVADYAVRERPDIVALTGDLVARRSGLRAYVRSAERLAASARHGAFAILGNHDLGRGNDPFAHVVDLPEVPGLRLLRDESVRVELAAGTIDVHGLDPQTHEDEGLALPAPARADLRLLLAHYPDALDELAPGEVDLVLAGHLHGGQICLPWPGGPVGLSHPSRRFLSGLAWNGPTVMHLSRGLGTTFVPFRLFAPPEATMLVLRGPLRVR